LVGQLIPVIENKRNKCACGNALEGALL